MEKVRIRTRLARETDSDMLATLRPDFMAGLEDAEIVAALLKDFAELRLRLPAEARDGVDLPQDAFALRQLAADAWAITVDALNAAEPA